MTIANTSTQYVGDFGNCAVGESPTYFLDFTGQLANGESIISAQWTCAVAVDSEVPDSNAANVAFGLPQITGNVTGQQFTGMVGGVKYLIQGFVITNQSNKLEFWTHLYCEVPV